MAIFLISKTEATETLKWQAESQRKMSDKRCRKKNEEKG